MIGLFVMCWFVVVFRLFCVVVWCVCDCDFGWCVCFYAGMSGFAFLM